MLAAARTIFLELEPIRIVAAILLCSIVPLFAVTALKRNDRADIFLLGCHLAT